MRTMKSAAILLAPIALADLAPSATATPPKAVHDIAITRLGGTIRLHNVPITPLRVLEDSRCAEGVSCVWAGRVRLSVRIASATSELTLGEPVQMVGGTLRFTSVSPPRKRDAAIASRDYRFCFRFDGKGATQLIRD
jgi:hypothetical protein